MKRSTNWALTDPAWSDVEPAARVTIDWLLDAIEYDAQHWPEGSTTRQAFDDLVKHLTEPSDVRLHNLRGRLAGVALSLAARAGTSNET